MSLCIRFWNDETGLMASADLILMSALTVMGVIVGLNTFRNEVVQRFGGLADALENLDQSYSFTVGSVTSQYADPPGPTPHASGSPPAGMSLTVPAPGGVF